MKKTSSVVISILLIFMSLIMTNSCKTEGEKNSFLRIVLKSLDQIKSASYYDMIESWAPGDTAPTFTTLRYYKEYFNPLDTTIGSSFAWLEPFDTTKLVYYYDGNAQAYVNWDEKTIPTDSFKTNFLPFRPLTPPFFNRTKSIIKYALETEDTISTEFEDLGDFILFRLEIYSDQQVEFFGKAFHLNNPFSVGQEISKCEIWINKSNNLPFRLRREMSHDIDISTCSNPKFNRSDFAKLIASEYFPPEFAIQSRKQGIATFKSNLKGKLAPDWVLNDASNNTIALKQLKSSVILLEFTSISCGPCLASIQFLKKLVSEYNEKDFDFVSIESWAKNSNVLKSYQRRNDFKYKFLMSTDSVTKSYQIRSVPVFYILDRNRVIRNIIIGYSVRLTDIEIRNAINELI
jgi:thiol-disulfide isomerase/thioredoxin